MDISGDLIKLEGQSVQLIPMEMHHLSDLWKAAEPEEIWEFTASKVRSIEQLESAMRSALKERDMGTQYPFVVIHKKDGKLIGSSRYLDISQDHKSLEIGWTWYNPTFWRTAVNTECKLLLLQHAFENWDMNRVQFKTDSRNVRSQAAIERLGAVKEGVLRKERILANGYVRDTVVFSILRDEWPLTNQKLQSLLRY